MLYMSGSMVNIIQIQFIGIRSKICSKYEGYLPQID